MAPVKIPIPPKVKDYWPRYHKKVLTYVISMQLVGIVVLGGSLFGIGAIDSTLDILVFVCVMLILMLGNIVMVMRLLEPLAKIAAVLTHISGEPTIVTPPHPNDPKFEKDGLKPLLELIYSISSKQGSKEEKGNEALVNFSDILATLPIGFVVMDANKKILYANKAAPVRVDSDSNSHLELIFDKSDDLDKWIATCSERSVRSEKIWQRIPNKIPGDEDRKIYDISATYEKGKSAEIVLALLDRSVLYQPEDEDLDFIAFAAHELRGPITVIRGYLDVLSEELAPSIDAEQSELMSRLTVSANRLSGYINNILNASRYDRRHLKLRLKEDSLANIYDSIRDDMELRASSQRRLLSVELPPTLPTVAADATGISEVLSNLIDNAIKYSHDGGIVQVTATASNDFVTVHVEDRGIGMPDQVIGNLFHKFYRSHRSRETVAGTGIGLYICKAIVESHGGTIGVRSVEGQGSVFSFSLPIYATVAEKLIASDNSNENLIGKGEGWIKNHSMYRG